MDKMLKQFTTEIRGIDEQERTLTALVSTATRDRMGEVLLPEGADIKAYQKNPVVLWAHDYTKPPIGKALWIKRTKEGVLSKIKFAPTEFAKEIFNLYKEGFLKAFSVGFLPKTWIDGDGDKTARRTYDKWEMVEYSAVPVPANPDALALMISKGMLSDVMKKEFNIVETLPEELTDEVEELPEETPKVDKSLLELIAELEAEIEQKDKTYKELISTLNNDNAELRYALYKALYKEPTSEPEITTGEMLRIAEQVASRVIRHATGKVS